MCLPLLAGEGCEALGPLQQANRLPEPAVGRGALLLAEKGDPCTEERLPVGERSVRDPDQVLQHDRPVSREVSEILHRFEQPLRPVGGRFGLVEGTQVTAARASDVGVAEIARPDPPTVIVFHGKTVEELAIGVPRQRPIAAIEHAGRPVEEFGQRRDELLVRTKAVLVIPVVAVAVVGVFGAVHFRADLGDQVIDFREQVVLSQGALNDVAGFLAGHECLQKSLSVLRGDDLGHGAEDRAQLIGRAGGEPLLDGLEEPLERNRGFRHLKKPLSGSPAGATHPVAVPDVATPGREAGSHRPEVVAAVGQKVAHAIIGASGV